MPPKGKGKSQSKAAAAAAAFVPGFKPLSLDLVQRAIRHAERIQDAIKGGLDIRGLEFNLKGHVWKDPKHGTEHMAVSENSPPAAAKKAAAAAAAAVAAVAAAAPAAAVAPLKQSNSPNNRNRGLLQTRRKSRSRSRSRSRNRYGRKSVSKTMRRSRSRSRSPRTRKPNWFTNLEPRNQAFWKELEAKEKGRGDFLEIKAIQARREKGKA